MILILKGWFLWFGFWLKCIFSELVYTVLWRSRRISKVTIDDLEVLYRNVDYVVGNKHYDVLLNCDEPNLRMTVQKQLRHRYPELVDNSLVHQFRFVNRLDYATSGIFCVALNRMAAAKATKLFEYRQVQKYYLAILRGHVAIGSLPMVIKLGVGIDTRSNHMHKMSTSDKAHCHNPRHAETKLLILQRGICCGFPGTKVLLKPTTGRRHQLRVHCSSIGHTIVGDYTYSQGYDVFPYRMFLHAFRLVFPPELNGLDIATSDPFVESNAWNKWLPVETINELDENAFNKISALL